MRPPETLITHWNQKLHMTFTRRRLKFKAAKKTRYFCSRPDQRLRSRVHDTVTFVMPKSPDLRLIRGQCGVRKKRTTARASYISPKLVTVLDTETSHIDVYEDEDDWDFYLEKAQDRSAVSNEPGTTDLDSEIEELRILGALI